VKVVIHGRTVTLTQDAAFVACRACGHDIVKPRMPHESDEHLANTASCSSVCVSCLDVLCDRAEAEFLSTQA
jgi:hypothetical protein